MTPQCMDCGVPITYKSTRCVACRWIWARQPRQCTRHPGVEFMPHAKTGPRSLQRTCRRCATESARRSYATLRQDVQNAYGGACQCCGETEPVFLAIDHINGHGGDHRRSLPALSPSLRPHKKRKTQERGSSTFYRWLRRSGYPKDDFQLLCFNCNRGKHVMKVCPHQTQPTAQRALDRAVRKVERAAHKATP